jgi:hypothetical protein
MDTFTLKIWNGETIYTMLEMPMAPETVVQKYGFLLAGIPMAILETVDGVASEINPLGNLLAKVGFEVPDNYKEFARSPAIISINNGQIRVEAGTLNPQLAQLTQDVQNHIPTWSAEQARLQQIINYTQSNLCIADAIEAASNDLRVPNEKNRGFLMYQRLIEDKHQKNQITSDAESTLNATQLMHNALRNELQTPNNK